MDKQIFKIVSTSLILITAIGSIFLLIQKSNQKNYLTTAIKLPTTIVAEDVPLSQISPDGTKTLTMNTSTSDNQVTYSFFTNSNPEISFTKTLTKASKFSIPFNTWSPDNKYVFIKETTPSTVNYYVLPGETNVSTKFKEKYPDHSLQEITGWAAPNLLIVNASKGNSNLSFWFDLSTKTFISLSNRFN